MVTLVQIQTHKNHLRIHRGVPVVNIRVVVEVVDITTNIDGVVSVVQVLLLFEQVVM